MCVLEFGLSLPNALRMARSTMAHRILSDDRWRWLHLCDQRGQGRARRFWKPSASVG
jgi:hypothetical protein